MRIINYNQKLLDVVESGSILDCEDCLDKDTVTWVKIDDNSNEELISSVSSYFGLDDLVVLDIMDTDSLPRAFDYQGYLFVSFNRIDFLEAQRVLKSERLCVVLGDHMLVSFHSDGLPSFDGIKERIIESQGQVRSKNADYLLYLLLNAVVEQNIETMSEISEQIESLEHEVLNESEDELTMKFLSLKKCLLSAKIAIEPFREPMKKIVHGKTNFIRENTLKYFEHSLNKSDQLIYSINSSISYLDSLGQVYWNQSQKN